ncbi:MAG: hypothetical protein QUS09_00285 [Methanotrichaceae archaeon]|nr:hypothetical protein [Methanotrichaceae archaeon]
MNQKAFAIFVGAIMVFSAFAGMVMLGGDQSQRPTPVGSDSLDTFGVQGRMVVWNFDSLGDVLEMAPESTSAAYWMNMSSSKNLTDAARASLPPSLGLSAMETTSIKPRSRSLQRLTLMTPGLSSIGSGLSAWLTKV